LYWRFPNPFFDLAGIAAGVAKFLFGNFAFLLDGPAHKN
jgi:hypothetical protein